MAIPSRIVSIDQALGARGSLQPLPRPEPQPGVRGAVARHLLLELLNHQEDSQLPPAQTKPGHAFRSCILRCLSRYRYRTVLQLQRIVQQVVD